ncbi:uncharacterized protein LOC121300677 [Polyodon spathula]|uniref:uncharacterized protein LOC121300677 n=1 Tax=Polyodon spathula TaxID=7913 RepID=UPI001B7DDF05|nr:uncharacterized protein LOC121300677 [Polyodon spathula]
MTSAAHMPASHQELKEFDIVKESISDIINQLQDIDPARLSFSPFLDLDTQISLAPVSDSPESSVEELNYLSLSSLGTRTSLEPPSGGVREEGPETACTLGRRHSISNKRECSETSVAQEEKEGLVVVTVTSETSFLDTVRTDGYRDGTVPQSQGGIPNGTEENRPQALNLNQFELTNQEATRDEEQPFLRPSPHAETIELVSHGSQGQPEDQPYLVTLQASDRGRCGCCRSARLRAVSSVCASLLLLPAMLYGLYFYLPFDPPLCPDLTSRITFTFRCCMASAAPIILGVLTAAVSRLCSPALHPLGACPRGLALEQLFVSASVEQLLLYALNLVIMATFLKQEQLRAVPTLAGVFGVGRLLYWLSLHLCSSLRGFSSGLTFFPLLAMAAFNLFCLFELGLNHLFPVPQGEAFSYTTPTPGLAILGG